MFRQRRFKLRPSSNFYVGLINGLGISAILWLLIFLFVTFLSSLAYG